MRCGVRAITPCVIRATEPDSTDGDGSRAVDPQPLTEPIIRAQLARGHWPSNCTPHNPTNTT